MKDKYYLYRLDTEGDAEIYGAFTSLNMATLSASLLLIRDFCFILSGDLTKIYFYNNGVWEYDILTEKGRTELFEIYPHPDDYK